MSAKLVIAAGPSAGTEFWIEDEVLRIGGDASCAVCLTAPGVPAHAATLEFRDGGYIVHNRQAQALLLDGKTLPQNSFASWPANGNLQLTRELVLALVVEGDPAPSKRPARRLVLPEADELSAVPGEPLPAKSGSTTVMQLLVIVVLFGLAGMLFVIDRKKNAPSADRDVPVEFAALVQDLSAAPVDGSSGNAAMRSVLQEARVAELRGHKDQARLKYTRVTEMLLPRRNPDGKFAAPTDEKAWKFVMSQLNETTE